MNLEKEFIPYELSLKLKELGPAFEFIAIWAVDYPDNKPWLKITNRFETIDDVPAILYQQAFDWFRTEKDLYPDIYRTGKLFSANIEDMLMGNSLCKVVREVTYEEARLECLKKLIELCNKK